MSNRIEYESNSKPEGWKKIVFHVSGLAIWYYVMWCDHISWCVDTDIMW